MIANILSVIVVLTPAATEQPTPRIFAPGVISGAAHDSAPAFSSDGRTVYFTRSNAQTSFILESHRIGDEWSSPALAPFSGEWLDMEPAAAPDGSYLVFVSNRPTRAGGAPLDGMINGVAQPRKGANLWIARRTGATWDAPQRLPDVVNANSSTYAPSVAASGNLYFMRPDTDTSRFRLFVARATQGSYERPVPLSFSDGTLTDVDPAVLPDESAIVFGSSRHSKKDIDLFIVFRHGDGWGEPAYLGDVINSPTSDAEPRWGPDHRTLYFSSERLSPVGTPISRQQASSVLRDMTAWNNGLYNIWTVNLADWLDRASSAGQAQTPR